MPDHDDIPLIEAPRWFTGSVARLTREQKVALARHFGFFEPMVLLVMGGIVLLLVLAIILPILNLNQLVQ